MFCLTCLDDRTVIEEDVNACPHPEDELAAVNKFLLNKISEMLICCRYKVHGCDFLSKVEYIELHEKHCPHLGHDCTVPECTSTVPQANFTRHV